MTAVFDIETNGLYFETTTIHCIAIKIEDNDTLVYTAKPIKGSAGSINEALDILSKCATLIGHNIINFDIPTITKLYPNFTYNKVLDTLLLSKLLYPNLIVVDSNRLNMPSKLRGSHSLKAWGYRLGNHKEQHEDWSILSEDMVEYCRQDVNVNYDMFKRFEKKGLPPEEAIWLEQEFARVISRQEKYGVLFDIDKAKALHIELLEEVDKAEKELFKVFKPLQDWIPVKQAKQYNKEGIVSKKYLAQVAKGCKYNDDLEWGYYETVTFNPSSRQHIARWLQEVYNWQPTEYTEKGSVIINDEVLNNLEFTEGKILAHYFNVIKLLGQLAEGDNAWLKLVKSDNRIHGSIDTLGAVTRRCTHRTPNMAQVPSARAFKGHECRGLFTVPKGKKLVGCDADALELRTLSHYMAIYDDGAYAKAVDEGKKENGTDIHTLNQQATGLATRDEAKTFILT